MTVATMELIQNPIQNSSDREEVNSLRRAIALKKSGDLMGARKLLVTICRQNTGSEAGWFLLASVARNAQERTACLKQVLRINPANQAALDWQRRMQPENIPPREVPAPSQTAAPAIEPVRAATAFPPLFAPVAETPEVPKVEAAEPEAHCTALVLAPMVNLGRPDALDAVPVKLENVVVSSTMPPPDVVTVISSDARIAEPALEMGETMAPAQQFTALETPETRRFENLKPSRLVTLPPPPVDLLAVPEIGQESRYVEVPGPPPVVGNDGSVTVTILRFDEEALTGRICDGAQPEPVLKATEPFAAPSAARIPLPTLDLGGPVTQAGEAVHAESWEAGASESVSPRKITTLPPAPVSMLSTPAMESDDRYAALPEPKPALSEASLGTPVTPAEIAPMTMVPSSGFSPAAEAPPQIVKAETEPEVLCPLCEAPMQNAERCGSCRSSIWPEKPMDYVLNRSADVELLHGLVERLRAEPYTVWGELRLALANANLHRFHYAKQHLERAAMLDLKASTYALDRMAAFLRRPVVMVVDDSATIRDVLVRLLGNDGFLPVPVGNSWEVMPAMKAQKPSVVLLDVTMPMMDGYDVCRLIRADRETKSIPVVMVSGNGDLIDKVVGKLAGASDYLHKPFKPEQLLNVVRGHVFKKR